MNPSGLGRAKEVDCFNLAGSKIFLHVMYFIINPLGYFVYGARLNGDSPGSLATTHNPSLFIHDPFWAVTQKEGHSLCLTSVVCGDAACGEKLLISAD